MGHCLSRMRKAHQTQSTHGQLQKCPFRCCSFDLKPVAVCKWISLLKLFFAGKGKSFVNGAKELAGKQDIMFGQPLKSTYANASAPNDISLNVYVHFISFDLYTL